MNDRVPDDRRGARARALRRLHRRRRDRGLREAAITSFSRLQRRGRERVPVFLYLFDLPRHDGEDLRNAAAARAQGAPAAGARVRRARALQPAPQRRARRGALPRGVPEGARGSDRQARRQPLPSGGRSRDWLKLKCHAEQELVIGGYTAPKGSRTEFGALLVGYYDDGGRSATPARWAPASTTHTLQRARRAAARARAGRVAVRALQADAAGHALGAARAGRRRSASRSGRATAACATRASSGCATTSPRATWCARCRREDVEITHPDKLLFPDDGITKADLAGYYERVSEWMLPHVEGPAGEHAALPRRDRRQGLLPQGHAGLLPRLDQARGGAEGGRHGHARGGLRRRHARLPGGAEHDHAARVALARATACGSPTGW